MRPKDLRVGFRSGFKGLGIQGSGLQGLAREQKRPTPSTRTRAFRMGVFSIPLWSQGWLLTRQLKFPNPKQTPPGPKAIPVRSLSLACYFRGDLPILRHRSCSSAASPSSLLLMV